MGLLLTYMVFNFSTSTECEISPRTCTPTILKVTMSCTPSTCSPTMLTLTLAHSSNTKNKIPTPPTITELDRRCSQQPPPLCCLLRGLIWSDCLLSQQIHTLFLSLCVCLLQPLGFKNFKEDEEVRERGSEIL